MNTRKSARRATSIDIIESIPTKQRKTKRTQRDSEMNYSNPELHMSNVIESENENETSNLPDSQAAQDEDSTQPLFPGADPSELLAQADLLLAEMNAHLLETRQNSSAVQNDDTEQKPSTSTKIENNETDNNETALNLSLNDQSSSTTNTNDSVRRSTSAPTQSPIDDSVILVDDVAMPRPSRSDEDVIFVEEYVKQPRVTRIVDLCSDDEDASVKTPAPAPFSRPTRSFQQVAQFQTSPVASASNGITVKCPVCLDTVPNEEVHSTTCGHLYCGPCIKNTVKARKKCPMCNTKLAMKQIHRIYFHN